MSKPIIKKTSTISFRIDSQYDQLLRHEAEEKRVSLNTLANQIFGEHLEWQRYTERFGTILMSKDAFRLVLESLSESVCSEYTTQYLTRNLQTPTGRLVGEIT